MVIEVQQVVVLAFEEELHQEAPIQHQHLRELVFPKVERAPQSRHLNGRILSGQAAARLDGKSGSGSPE